MLRFHVIKMMTELSIDNWDPSPWQDDYINTSDKNKLFMYPENELENQESVFNPTSGAVDM